MDSQIDDYIQSLQKHGVKRLTFTLTEAMEPVVVANQVIHNRSGLTSEHTHAHKGRSYADACLKVQKDVESIGETQPKILTLNGGN